MKAAGPVFAPPYALTISEERQFVYCRVPKVATHSMNSWLAGTFHPPPRWHESAFLPQALDGWFVFSLVRNPWDRIAATWREKAQGATRPVSFYAPWVDRPFPDFVEHLASLDLDRVEPHVRRQSALIPMQRVDFVGRLEEIDHDLEILAKRLGVSTKAFGQLNRGPSRLRGDYRDLYDEHSAARVGELYREEIDAFGYTFDGPTTRPH